LAEHRRGKRLSYSETLIMRAYDLKSVRELEKFLREPPQFTFLWSFEDPRATVFEVPVMALADEIVRLRERFQAQSHHAKWPPKRGDTIYFETPDGIQVGILKAIRRGLVWRDFHLMDGRVVWEKDLVMLAEPASWRDPDTVSEAERKKWVNKVRAEADKGVNIMEYQPIWAMFCEYVMFTMLRIGKERWRAMTAHESETEYVPRPS
jgi:hypothetical protein